MSVRRKIPGYPNYLLDQGGVVYFLRKAGESETLQRVPIQDGKVCLKSKSGLNARIVTVRRLLEEVFPSAGSRDAQNRPPVSDSEEESVPESLASGVYSPTLSEAVEDDEQEASEAPEDQDDQD